MITEAQVRRMIGLARQGRRKAHSTHRPKQIKVGAAVLTASGRVYTGCNISNRSSTLGMCAERVALYSAVAAGHKRFKALVVVGGGATPWPPCGACREVLNEFDRDGKLEVIFTDSSGRKVERAHLRDLYPMPFTPLE